MIRQIAWNALASIVFLVLIPRTAFSQEVVPPVIFTGPISYPVYDESSTLKLTLGNGVIRSFRLPFWENADIRCSVVSEAAAPHSPIPSVGIVADYFLANTVVGGFSAGMDLLVNLSYAGPGMNVHWHPWEGITLSVRYDLVRRSLTPEIAVFP